MSFVGLKQVVASRPRTIEGVSGLMNLAMFPMWIFSGVFFSNERFPQALQPFIQLLPLTALNDAMRAVMLEGASLVSQSAELAILAGLNRRLRWRSQTVPLELTWRPTGSQSSREASAVTAVPARWRQAVAPPPQLVEARHAPGRAIGVGRRRVGVVDRPAAVAIDQLRPEDLRLARQELLAVDGLRVERPRFEEIRIELERAVREGAVARRFEERLSTRIAAARKASPGCRIRPLSTNASARSRRASAAAASGAPGFRGSFARCASS
ncbi:MAG: ABC transporter permease [Thermoanaerobaculia bacterium]